MRRIICTLVILLGCQQEKSKAEKHAEEMAAQKASASAAAKASAAEVDPKEAKFAANRKALKDRVTAQMTALEKLYLGASDADRTAFREYFAPGKEGETDADNVSKEAMTAAKNTKMSLKKWEISDLNFDAAQTTGTADLMVEESQAGGKSTRCVTYKTEWKEFSGKWYRVAQKDFRIVACPPPA
jgi:hypothetical protein